MEENALVIALQMALRTDTETELYKTLVALYITFVEASESVASLVSLCGVKARTEYGARGLYPKLSKRAVYRIEFLLSNGLAEAADVNAFALQRFWPRTDDTSAEAVDLRSCLERLVVLCNAS